MNRTLSRNLEEVRRMIVDGPSRENPTNVRRTFSIILKKLRQTFSRYLEKVRQIFFQQTFSSRSFSNRTQPQMEEWTHSILCDTRGWFANLGFSVFCHSGLSCSRPCISGKDPSRCKQTKCVALLVLSLGVGDVGMACVGAKNARKSGISAWRWLSGQIASIVEPPLFGFFFKTVT